MGPRHSITQPEAKPHSENGKQQERRVRPAPFVTNPWGSPGKSRDRGLPSLHNKESYDYLQKAPLGRRT